MIYWDNAATTWPKPKEVRLAVGQALVQYGANPGRGGHPMSLATAEAVYRCRQSVADFFGLKDPSGVVFTANCTASLNTVIRGILERGGRALTSDLEHNAVMRPLYALGNRFDVAAWSEDDEQTVENFRRGIRADTKLLICTHASNVFGVTLPIEKLGKLAKEYGLLFCVDAAQTAGVLPIDMEHCNIDYLCVAPHKGLYGPMGTGLLLCRERDKIAPLIRGGTGNLSMKWEQPPDLPERLESGTLNIPGICGIDAGLAFINKTGRAQIYRHEIACLQQVYDVLKSHSAVSLYTPRPQIGRSASVLSLNVGTIPSERVAKELNGWGIAVRAGLHCAPAAHKRFGTLPNGTIRLAPSAFTTVGDAQKIGKVFCKIAEKTLR